MPEAARGLPCGRFKTFSTRGSPYGFERTSHRAQAGAAATRYEEISPRLRISAIVLIA